MNLWLNGGLTSFHTGLGLFLMTFVFFLDPETDIENGKCNVCLSIQILTLSCVRNEKSNF